MCNLINCKCNCLAGIEIGDQVQAKANGLVYIVVGIAMNKKPILERTGVHPFVANPENFTRYTPPVTYTGYMNLYYSMVDEKLTAGDVFKTLQKAKQTPGYRNHNWKGLIRFEFEEGFEAKELRLRGKGEENDQGKE